MKLKVKTSWIGLFLIATMLFSTFAYAIIQSFSSPSQNLQLPETNIINYQLDPNLRAALLQYGVTLMTFDYNLVCEDCVNQKSNLEFLANEYKEQIFLEEIRDDSLSVSKLTVESVYGKDELVGANETQIFHSLCKLMVAPPVSCALISK